MAEQSDKVIGESEASNAASHAEITLSASAKRRRKRSAAWDHFTEVETSEGTKAKYSHCCKLYYFKSRDGTSTLLGHLSTCPKLPTPLVDKKQSTIGFKSILGGSQGDVAVVSWKFDQEECRKALCRMVIVDELSFSFVEKEGFKEFMKMAQPHFWIPSRSTVTRDCFNLFNEEKQKLRRYFIETKQRICITTDTWTSIQRINYMCITAHWIDSDWNMRKKILNFCPIISHKGEDMANGISRCLCEWGINKIFTITVDNASSNDVTVKELSKQLTKMGTNLMNGNHLHVRCMAHIMNLVVQDGLKECSLSIERVRHAVRYVRQSPARLKRFQESCDDEQLSCKKSLCLDVPTRWNSTYLMLSRAVEFENAFSNYASREIGLRHYLENSYVETGITAGELLSSDWVHVKRITRFLEIFYLLTLKISGSRYVTSNIHFLEICAVAVYLNQLMASEDTGLSDMAKKMQEKFNKYWGDPAKMNKIIFISCILDPRYKLESVSYALVKMFGEKGPSIQAEIKKYMTSLFSEYVKSNSKGSVLAQSSPCSSLDTSTSGLPNSQVSTQSTGLLESFMKDLKNYKTANGGVDARTELDKYFGEETEDDSKEFNILNWWKMNSARFPILAEMARDVLAVPVSSVASESAFSTGGRLLDSFRSSLTPNLVQALVCLQDWLRSEKLQQSVSVEEDLNNLEQLEQVFVHYLFHIFGALYNFLTIANPAGSLVFSSLVASSIYDMEAEKQAQKPHEGQLNLESVLTSFFTHG
ncbi:zinc finger BED domain-containing protein RICESLEEPER 1-like [Solanum dulcamara]|uniref:zinc finger BED domain-containing protein RICESLEEPER 1-like n=1 Tax=Solanum dulcamara TaxID=45834 RepID=UPI0024853811|nr:zinc finger BED domain-containing protein RICESLEEPER 1-like [Solanum dulcamara]